MVVSSSAQDKNRPQRFFPSRTDKTFREATTTCVAVLLSRLNSRFLPVTARVKARTLACLLTLTVEVVSGQTNLPSARSFPGGEKASSRVVVVHDSRATESFQPNTSVVRDMVNRGIRVITGSNTVAAAWLGFVATNDIVGIKVHSAPGPNSGTRPAVVAAVVEGLLASGLPARQIVIWDKNATDLRLAGYLAFEDRYGVRVESSLAAGWDPDVFYDTPFLGNLLWGDLEFGSKKPGAGRKSFVTKLLTKQITKVINIPSLLNHNATGVAGNLSTLALASVDNTFRFENEPARLAVAVPEIYAVPDVGDRVVLSIVDALIGQYQGSELSRLHYSSPLNELLFSRDPVALDVLSIDKLRHLRAKAGVPAREVPLDLYRNAALLEFGVCDLSKIDVDEVDIRSSAQAGN